MSKERIGSMIWDYIKKGIGSSMKENRFDSHREYKRSIWYKIERFFDRHNHLMEFIRTILALMVLCLQFYILTRL